MACILLADLPAHVLRDKSILRGNPVRTLSWEQFWPSVGSPNACQSASSLTNRTFRLALVSFSFLCLTAVMPYITLSEQIKKLHNPQRSDAFVKQLRTAVRQGDIEAMELPSRFELPKAFTRRSGGETYRRSVKDMVIDSTAKFEAWFDNTNRELSTARTGGRLKVSLETVEAGLVDFKALAAETRRKMGNSFSKGQALGKSRGAKKPKPAPKKTPVKRK